MAFSIKDDYTDKLTRELAKLRGIKLTQAVRQSVEHELARAKQARQTSAKARVRTALKITQTIAQAPVLDKRNPDEMMGFNEYGAFD